MRRSTETPPSCGSDCTFQALYTGAQVLINQRNADHAKLLNRNRRLIEGISRVLRELAPTRHSELESELGVRLVDINDDALIISCLEAFTRDLRLADPDGLVRLREALSTSGYVLPPPDDPGLWATAVANQRPVAAAPAPSAPPATGTPAPRAGVEATPTLRPPTPRPQPATVATTPSQGRVPDDDLFDDLFDTAPPLGELFDDLDDTPSPAEPELHEPEPFDEGPSILSTDEDDLFGDPASPTPPVPGDDLDDLFGDEPGPSGPEDTDLVDLFDEPVPASASLGDLFSDLDVHHDAEPARATVSHHRRPPAAPQTLPLLPKSTQPAKKAPAKKAPAKRVRSTRKPRTQVTPASDTSQVDLADTSAEDRLLAAILVPRPVFRADLEGLATADELDAWIESHMTTGGDVRVVVTKRRYKHLGVLIVPQESMWSMIDGFDSSAYAQVLEQYRTGRLVEMAVLLRELDDGKQLISWEFAEHTAQMLLNTPRGVTGVVVALDSNPAEHATELGDRIDALLSQRLTLLGVLTSNAEAAKLIDGTLEELATMRGWRPAFPVATACTWEWTSVGAATARVVLGN